MVKVSVKFIIILLECFVVMTLSIMLLVLCNKDVSVPVYDLMGPSMLLRDWSAKPLIDIYIPDNDMRCPSGYDPIFTQKWPGTVKGCLVDDDLVMTYDEYFNEFIGDFDAPDCTPIEAQPAVIQEEILT
jgi:hypothetical protein